MPSMARAPNAVGDVAAGDGGAADVVDAVMELEFGFGMFVDELPPPIVAANFRSPAFAIFEDFYLAHLALGGECDDVVDELLCYYLSAHCGAYRVPVPDFNYEDRRIRVFAGRDRPEARWI